MCLPKKTIVQYKNAVKEVKQKLKTVELEWKNLDKALTYSPCLNAGDSWIQTILAY